MDAAVVAVSDGADSCNGSEADILTSFGDGSIGKAHFYRRLNGYDYLA